MIFRFFILLIGFGLAVAGGVSIIAYLNLLIAGYDFQEYMMFLVKRVELYIFIIGIIMIWGSIYINFSRRKRST